MRLNIRLGTTLRNETYRVGVLRLHFNFFPGSQQL